MTLEEIADLCAQAAAELGTRNYAIAEKAHNAMLSSKIWKAASRREQNESLDSARKRRGLPL